MPLFQIDPLEEEALWRGIIEGNQLSFEVIYNRYFKQLYNYGRKICSNNTILEDAIHDLFLDLWKYHANLSPTTSIKFYLYRALRRRIIRNEVKDRESSVFGYDVGIFLDKQDHSLEQNIINSETSNEQSQKLKKYLQDLPDRQREALTLRFYDEFSYEEIATLLEVNEQSARNLIQRALQHIKNVIKMMIWFLGFTVLHEIPFLLKSFV